MHLGATTNESPMHKVEDADDDGDGGDQGFIFLCEKYLCM
jgi:hypothetical protein